MMETAWGYQELLVPMEGLYWRRFQMPGRHKECDSRIDDAGEIGNRRIRDGGCSGVMEEPGKMAFGLVVVWPLCPL